MTGHSVVRSAYGPGNDQGVVGDLDVVGTLSTIAPGAKVLWRETDVPVDDQAWEMLTAAGQFRFRAKDALGATANIMLVDRTGIVIDLLNFPAPVRVTTFGVGVAPIARPAVAGSRGANVALASLLTALDAYGLITDNTVI